MQEEVTEGIVLHAMPYKERQKLLTLLTPGRGVLSAITGKIVPGNLHAAAATSVLTRGEYILREGKDALYTLIDAEPISHHTAIRARLDLLATAQNIAQAIRVSQLPGMHSLELYQLTVAYLQHLAQGDPPDNLLASFLLKFLRLEGCFSPQTMDHLTFFCEEDRETIALATYSRSFATIAQMTIRPSLLQQVRTLFGLQLTSRTTRG